MDKARYAKRREKLRVLMRAKGLDALLLTLDANRFYVSGFELQDHQVNESSGCVLVTANGTDWLCTDPRYDDAAKRLWDPSHIFIYGGDAAKSVNALVRDKVSGVVGFEESAMTVQFYKSFSEGLTLQPADGLVEQLRMIKEPEEIARMQASAALNHKLMEWLPGTLCVGKTEEEIAWSVEQYFRQNGAESLAFPCITAVGANAALPHAVPGKTAVTENSCVLVDVGCRLDDYCSDQTRTFWVGDKPTGVFMETITLVRTAQERAIEAIRPGVAASAVYAVAREFLEAAGVARNFTHGLGHGVGLQTHEGPSLNPRNETILQPGMVVTVEPGLYYPEWGGVRWEYMVLVTEEGRRIL
ncbi:Peptidase, M24 family [uncultured delta proteobacterium]|uniref:Peptidase, M24 family n=1 Tax=uncultured delta proteobacterium TaxID=34034 RepID=A0A212JPW0_9DELT|nr:Peptidase, M24 family [uncultured delta proteobacterium]